MLKRLNVKMPRKGFTLIEVLVGTFLILIVFLGIFAAYQLGLKVVGQSKNRITATAIASGEIEKVRNLPYESIGIIGGFPEGDLESIKTTTINNIEYIIETRVDYVVDSADGISAPEDECPNDYKRMEVKISWSGLSGGEVKLITDVSPENLAQECAETGGILLISVFDAYGMMVTSPLIEIKIPATGEVVKTATPIEGKHFFSLVPTTYKVVISKTNYSSERTYGVEEIATPEKPHLIVLEGELAESSFSIDKVSSFSVDTLSPWGMDYFSDSFLDITKVSQRSDVIVAGGKVVLEDVAGVYKNSGYLISTPITPANLISWQEFSFNDFETAGTQILYQVLYFDGESWILIPDFDLPGNSTGFETSPVDLSGLGISIYSQLELGANLSTIDTAVTPILYDWQVSWRTSEAVPIPNVSFNLQGEKIIGTDGDEQPVYKYSQDHVSGGDGHINISNLEWDNYTFSVDPATGLDLEDTGPSPQPIDLSPDTSLPVILYLEAQDSLLVTVQNIDTGEPIFSANVRLYNLGLGYDNTQYTNEDGETYFIPLETAVYTIEVGAPGYLDFSGTVSVLGDTTKIINLERIE